MKLKVKQELGNLFVMCLNANKSEEYNVFFNFSGHVDAVHLRITTNDNDNEDDDVYYEALYIEGDLYSYDVFERHMNIWKNELMKIINPLIDVTTGNER